MTSTGREALSRTVVNKSGGSRVRASMVIRAGRQLVPLLLVSLVLACTSDDEPPRAVSFYAEVAVEVELSRDDPLVRYGRDENRAIVRWWYATDPVRWRWEIEGIDGTIDDGMAVTVFDGTDSWAYDDRPNTFQRGVISAAPGTMVLSPIFSMPVGPANAETIDGFIEHWREGAGIPEVTRAGEATLLGRRTQIVELRPSSGDTIRAFIDPERMFTMRWAVDGGDGRQSFHAEVTTLDYDTEIDAARFIFNPPPGARETEVRDAQSCSGSSSVGGTTFAAASGFLGPSYAPPGYRSTSAGSAASAYGGCGPVAVWARLESPGGGYIVLRQRHRAGGIPESARSWQAVDSGLDDAYRRSENGVLSLLWRNGNVVALLETDSVSFEELLRIAESSELVP